MKYLLADKAYDTDKIPAKLFGHMGRKHVSHRNVTEFRPAKYDSELALKKRRIIENMFGQLKDWRV